MTFNEKVDNFMQENNISSLKQLATLSNIPYTTLRDFYEKRSADNSRLSTIRKLSQYMNCTMDYLAYDDITNINSDKENQKNNEIDNLLFSKAKELTDEDKIAVINVIDAIKRNIDNEEL